MLSIPDHFHIQAVTRVTEMSFDRRLIDFFRIFENGISNVGKRPVFSPEYHELKHRTDTG
jgi:hypothetical protein